MHKAKIKIQNIQINVKVICLQKLCFPSKLYLLVPLFHPIKIPNTLCIDIIIIIMTYNISTISITTHASHTQYNSR